MAYVRRQWERMEQAELNWKQLNIYGLNIVCYLKCDIPLAIVSSLKLVPWEPAASFVSLLVLRTPPLALYFQYADALSRNPKNKQ